MLTNLHKDALREIFLVVKDPLGCHSFLLTCKSLYHAVKDLIATKKRQLAKLHIDEDSFYATIKTYYRLPNGAKHGISRTWVEYSDDEDDSEDEDNPEDNNSLDGDQDEPQTLISKVTEIIDKKKFFSLYKICHYVDGVKHGLEEERDKWESFGVYSRITWNNGLIEGEAIIGNRQMFFLKGEGRHLQKYENKLYRVSNVSSIETYYYNKPTVKEICYDSDDVITETIERPRIKCSDYSRKKYDNNGTLIWQEVQEGEKHWRKTWDEGRLTQEATLAPFSSALEGKCRTYNNRSETITANYVNNQLSGLYLIEKNGLRSQLRYYDRGSLHGECILYQEGILFKEINYDKGCPYGRYQEWYPNGELKVRTIIKTLSYVHHYNPNFAIDNNPNIVYYGEYLEYNDSGVLILSCNYNDQGLLDGISKQWNDEGELISVKQYVNGVFKPRIKLVL